MRVGQIRSSSKIYRLLIFVVIGLIGGLAYGQIMAKSAPPTVKIGLVAPFEGLYRSTGYEVLFAVKLALQERNQAGGLEGYRVELVALNDFNDPEEAVRQATALITDPDVVGVVGHLTSATTLAAVPIYQAAEMAVSIPWSVEDKAFEAANPGLVSVAASYEETMKRLDVVGQEMGLERVEAISRSHNLAVPADVQAVKLTTDAVAAGTSILAWRASGAAYPLLGDVEAGNLQLIQVAGGAANGLVFVSPAPGAADVADHKGFVEAYEAISGLLPGPRAVLAYDATNVLLDSIEQVMIMNDSWLNKPPGRATIAAAIAHIQREGLTGKIAFDKSGRRSDAPVWVYQISESTYPGSQWVPELKTN